MLVVLAKQNRVRQHWRNFCKYLQASWWPSTSMWSGGNIWECICHVVQHTSLNLTLKPLTHLECFTIRLMELYVVKMKNEKKIMKILSKVWIVRIWHCENKVLWHTTFQDPHQYVYIKIKFSFSTRLKFNVRVSDMIGVQIPFLKLLLSLTIVPAIDSCFPRKINANFHKEGGLGPIFFAI